MREALALSRRDVRSRTTVVLALTGKQVVGPPHPVVGASVRNRCAGACLVPHAPVVGACGGTAVRPQRSSLASASLTSSAGLWKSPPWASVPPLLLVRVWLRLRLRLK